MRDAGTTKGDRERHTDRRRVPGAAWTIVAAGLIVATMILWSARHSSEQEDVVAGAHLLRGPSAEPALAPATEPASGLAAPAEQTAPMAGAPGVPDVARTPPQSAVAELLVPCRVVDDRGEPVADAEVSLEQWSFDGGHPARTAPPSAITDTRGLCELRGLTQGEWYFGATARGFVSASMVSVAILADGHDRLWCSLPREAGLEGTLVARHGIVQPQASVSVRLVEAFPVPQPESALRKVDGVPNRDHATTTPLDGDGRYSVQHLAPGRYLVVASPPTIQGGERLRDIAESGGSSASAMPLPDGVVEITLSPGETRTLDLQLPRVTGVRGRLLSGSLPVRDGFVVAFARSPDTGLARKARCDAAGTYALDDLPLGAYDLVAFAGGEAWPRSRGVELTENDELVVDFVFAGVSLTGTVIDERSSPVRGQVALAVPFVPLVVDPPSLESAAILAFHWPAFGSDAATSATSGADGRFEIPRLGPGRYSVISHGDLWLAGPPVEVTIGDSESPPPIELSVTRGARIEGTLHYAADGPAHVPDGLEVSVWEVDARRASAIAELHAGSFQFEALTPGTYELRARDLHAYPEIVYRVRTIELRPGAIERVDAILSDG